MALNLSLKPLLLKIAAVVIIYCMVLFVFGTTGLRTPAPGQTAPELSAREKQIQVQQAQARYGRKEIARAEESPKAASLYPGLSYLEQGRRAGAQHLEIPPISKNTLTIPENHTENHTKMNPSLNPSRLRDISGVYRRLIISSTTASMFGGL
jgi:hypothetical protein